MDYCGNKLVDSRISLGRPRIPAAPSASPGVSRNQRRLDAGDRQDDRGRPPAAICRRPWTRRSRATKSCSRPAPPTRATSSCRPSRAAGKWITIRTSNMAGLPKEGTRVGPNDAAAMPKIVDPNGNGAISTALQGRLLSPDRPGGHGRADREARLGVGEPGKRRTRAEQPGRGRPPPDPRSHVHPRRPASTTASAASR